MSFCCCSTSSRKKTLYDTIFDATPLPAELCEIISQYARDNVHEFMNDLLEIEPSSPLKTLTIMYGIDDERSLISFMEQIINKYVIDDYPIYDDGETYYCFILMKNTEKVITNIKILNIVFWITSSYFYFWILTIRRGIDMKKICRTNLTMYIFKTECPEDTDAEIFFKWKETHPTR